jgi:hypothetical protein
VLTHERNRASLREIEEWWSLTDLAEAHLALDVHDELAEKVAAEHRRKQEEAQRRSGRRR